MLFTGYQRGAYYPTQHFEFVIESLVASIQSHAGEVCLNQQVDSYLLEGQAVTGVQVTDKTNGEEYTVMANTVVCNADPRGAAEQIGLEHFSKGVREKLNYGYSASNFMIYCTVKGLDLKAHGFGRWNTFHCGDDDINTSFDRMYVDHVYSNPSFAITTPGLMTEDRSDRSAGEEVVEILTVADYDYFAELLTRDRRRYLKVKRQIVDSIFDVIEDNYIPNFRQHVNFKVAGTPTTNERFCWAPNGNSYGSNMTPENISLNRLSHETSLERFYFCNASSGWPGFAGSFFNGMALSNRLLKPS